MKIELQEFSPGWAEVFQAERLRIQEGLDDLIAAVEHIGSTSIPGLAAKPVIDIQVGVERLMDFDAAGGIRHFEGLGYTHNTAFLEAVPYRRLFVLRPIASAIGFNVHLVELEHPWWQRHLVFRDYLRVTPAACQRYEETKRRLAEQDWESVPDYAGAKTEVIWALEEEAFEWAGYAETERERLRSSRVG